MRINIKEKSALEFTAISFDTDYTDFTDFTDLFLYFPTENLGIKKSV